MNRIYEHQEPSPKFLPQKLQGLDEQKKRLEAYCQFVWSNEWEKMSRSLGFMPTILLHGPPGTGKTSLLRMLASSNKKSFEAIYFQESLDMLVDQGLGETSKAIKGLFDEISDSAMCGKKVYLQLDDIDSVLASRFTPNESSGIRRGVNTFLAELDGLVRIKAEHPPIIAASTNMFSFLDAAIKRRFSLKLRIDPILNENELRQLIGPMEKIIVDGSEIDYAKMATIVREKSLTPHDIVLVLQNLYIDNIIGLKVTTEQMNKALKICESSKVALANQENIYYKSIQD